MTFYGYRRPDGRVGVRNKVLILPTSVCASDTARIISQQVEGSVTFNNQQGCSQVAVDQQLTMDVMAGYAATPNIYGTVLVSLGCENCQMDLVAEAIAERTNKPMQRVIIQEAGGTLKAVEQAVRYAKQMVAEAGMVQREEFPISELIVGTECGGSDPTSGFSSNTVLGLVTDEVIDAGGTAILSETVECIGAEHILRQNGRTPEIGEQIYQAILDWEQKRYEESGQDVRCGNPSPGNIAGGITTLTEKSLGCIHKAGSRPFDGCFEYGQWIDKKGLYFVNAAASDVLSVTALAAAGATLVAFTTGLGNPIGNPVTPVVKITGNHDTAEALCEIIDIDTSASIRGEKSLQELKTEMLSVFADVMNGKKTRAEENGANELSINQCYSYA